MEHGQTAQRPPRGRFVQAPGSGLNRARTRAGPRRLSPTEMNRAGAPRHGPPSPASGLNERGRGLQTTGCKCQCTDPRGYTRVWKFPWTADRCDWTARPRAAGHRLSADRRLQVSMCGVLM